MPKLERPRRARRALTGLKAADLRVRPLARAETIPSAWYTDPCFHDLDRDAVFAATWQHVADVQQLAHAGDHGLADVAGEPIIVVRASDGELRAFYNVCRHRGGPLALKDGNADMLICKYHGWTYRLDGMLRGVPHFNLVELFDKRDYGLTRVELGLWEGLVFVSLCERPKPLEIHVSGIRERIAPTPVGGLTVARRYYYDAVTSAAARERIEADVTFSDTVQREDAEICERVQRGLGSRAYDKGRFSVRFEEGVYHFQKLLKNAYRTWLKR